MSSNSKSELERRKCKERNALSFGPYGKTAFSTALVQWQHWNFVARFRYCLIYIYVALKGVAIFRMLGCVIIMKY